MSVDPGAVAVGAASLLIGVVLGRPEWWLARRRMREQQARDAEARKLDYLRETADAVAEILGVPGDRSTMPPMSSANPSISDKLDQALEETAALTAAAALFHHMLELHLADDHGGSVPDYMLRAAASAWLVRNPPKP